MFRSPARVFAPLALVACAVAVLVIVKGDTGSSHHKSTTPQTSSTSTTTTTKSPRKHKRFYIVKPSDTLSAISIKTGVPLDTLQRLNPKVDPQALHAGQKLKLVP